MIKVPKNTIKHKYKSKGGLVMTNKEEEKNKRIRKKEMRTEEISNMISEGGLGADKYYDIKKGSSSPEKEKRSSKENKNEDE